MNTIKAFSSLFICLLIPLTIGGLSVFATASGINDWYVTLNNSNDLDKHPDHDHSLQSYQ